MRKLKAYTLIEMLVVMTIMIILLGVGFSAYASFSETTKYNQDISALQHDILIIQRASMLLEKESEEYWPYGIGIDFEGLRGEPSQRTGKYTFFKWCSEFTDFGASPTKGRYPRYDLDQPGFDGYISTVISQTATSCDVSTENRLIPLSRYYSKPLSLKEDVVIESDIRFLLFESVSGRAFLYDITGQRVDEDLEILFRKNFGGEKTLVVDNLSGRTKIVEETTP